MERHAWWLDDDLEVRRLQRELSDAARAWDEAGREPTGLFAGRRLQAVRDGRRTGEITVNDTELAFVRAGEQREQRDRRRTLLLTPAPARPSPSPSPSPGSSRSSNDAPRRRRPSPMPCSWRPKPGRSLATGATQPRRSPSPRCAPTTTTRRSARSSTRWATPTARSPTPSSPTASPPRSATSFTADGAVVVGVSDGSLRFVDPFTGREAARVFQHRPQFRDRRRDRRRPDIVAGGADGGVAVIPRRDAADDRRWTLGCDRVGRLRPTVVCPRRRHGGGNAVTVARFWRSDRAARRQRVGCGHLRRRVGHDGRCRPVGRRGDHRRIVGDRRRPDRRGALDHRERVPRAERE